MLSSPQHCPCPGCAAKVVSESVPMATVERPSFGTHEVANQPPPLVDYNVFEADSVLVEAVKREGAEWDMERIAAAGEYAGSEAAQELGRPANEEPPQRKTHRRVGPR